MSEKNKASIWVDESPAVKEDVKRENTKAPEDKPIKQDKPKGFALNPNIGDEYRYQIKIQQKFCVKQKAFTNTTTDLIWKYRLVDLKENHHFIELIAESFEVTEESKQMGDLLKFAAKFNEPTKTLLLAIEPNGGIKLVLNQANIYDKWLKLKEEEFESYLNDPSMAGLFNSAEMEYKDSLPSLMTNLLYILFFNDVYGKTVSKQVVEGEDISTNSKLFQGTFIPLKNKKKLERVPEGITVLNKYEAKISSLKILDLENNYNVNYSELIKEDFKYEYWMKSKALYSAQNGILENLKAKAVESANDGLYHESVYNIQLIK